MVGVTGLGLFSVVLIWLSGKWVGAEQVYHLVGGDRGWDPSSDISAWSSSTTFRIGDYVWFTYSRAEGKIAELKTKEEYDSCDVRNPIRMYTDGLNTIKLHEKGIRYFVSSNTHHCKNGLKLHVEVLPEPVPSDTPKIITSESESLAFAAGPTPSRSGPLPSNCSFAVLLLLFQCLITYFNF